MRRTERGIAAVLCVAVPVVVHGHQLAADVLAHAVVDPGVLVDVVAEVHHEIQVLTGHVFVRGEVTLLVVLARRDRESQAIDRRLRPRKRACAADGAQRVTGTEPIPVPAVGLEAGHFHVDRVRPFRRRTSPFRP